MLMKNKSNIFIIGDIHGCNKTFQKLLNRLSPQKDDMIYLLGDYIDRGPGSKEVVDIILDLEKQGYKLDYLRGNHEQMLLDSLRSQNNFYIWLKNGAGSTLRSYGAKTPAEIPAAHIDFYRKTKYFIDLDNYILVHGGMNFHISNPLKDTQAMVWIRNNYVDIKKTKGKKLITGHTPVSPDQVRHSLTTDKIMLDSGCVYVNQINYLGYLTALELNSFELTIQRNIDDTP